MQDNERLLKLYESGLPVWAIFLPTYGLYYRPWMRRMTWTMFIVVSVFSMACGFYDLYKNVPHLDQVDHSARTRPLCDHMLLSTLLSILHSEVSQQQADMQPINPCHLKRHHLSYMHFDWDIAGHRPPVEW